MVNRLIPRRWPLRLVPSTRTLTTSLRTLPNATPATITSHFPDSNSNATFLYLLHPHLPNLDELLNTIQLRFPRSIGSFVSPTSMDTPTLYIIKLTPDVDERIDIFRSEILGRPSVSVGKYHRLDIESKSQVNGENGKQGEEIGDVERVLGKDSDWSGMWDSTLNIQDELPKSLKGLSNIKSMIILSDATPEPLISLINRTYPETSILGLITPPTPFITGRPHTLIHDREIFSNGAIGIVISTTTFDSSKIGKKGVGVEVGVVYDGLEMMGDVLVVDRAQGNLLISCESPNENPTKTLIKYIQKYQSFNDSKKSNSEMEGKKDGQGLSEKDDDYYLAFLNTTNDTNDDDDDDANNNNSDQNPSSNRWNKINKIVKILSGDPNRGILGLNMEDSLNRGMRVQFMRRSPTPPTLPTPGDLIFTVIPPHTTFQPRSSPILSRNDMIRIPTTEGVIMKESYCDGLVVKVAGSSGWMRMRD